MKKVLKKLRFGLVHIAKGGFPLAGSAVNLIESVTGKDLATGEPKDVDWSKVVLKALGVVVFIYLYKQGVIPADELLEIIKGLF